MTVALVDAGGNAARSYSRQRSPAMRGRSDVTAADAQALADGTYTVTADVADQAGNPAARATSTLIVDETAPAVAPTLSESAETTAPAKPIVDGTAPLDNRCHGRRGWRRMSARRRFHPRACGSSISRLPCRPARMS